MATMSSHAGARVAAIAARAREPSSPARLEAIAALWERLRAQTRETEAYNLDRKLHVVAMFQEIFERARALG